MHKVNVFLIAGALAVAAVLGATAALRTTSLGRAHRASADAAVVARANQLDRFEAALRAQLAKRPPALPAVTRAAPPAPSPRIVYRRPPAIVVVRHTHHGDDGASESAEGGDGGGD